MLVDDEGGDAKLWARIRRNPRVILLRAISGPGECDRRRP